MPVGSGSGFSNSDLLDPDENGPDPQPCKNRKKHKKKFKTSRYRDSLSSSPDPSKQVQKYLKKFGATVP